jgi:hypothetical protein
MQRKVAQFKKQLHEGTKKTERKQIRKCGYGESKTAILWHYELLDYSLQHRTTIGNVPEASTSTEDLFTQSDQIELYNPECEAEKW